MKIIELTAHNINQYLEECIDVQQHLIQDSESVNGNQFKLTAAAEHNYFIAVIEDERVVGLGVVNKIIHPVRTNAYIDNIVVHPDFRGRGFFTVIMDDLEAKAAQWGAKRIKLTCSRAPVQPLYEKRGYAEKDTKYFVKKI